MAEFRCWDPDNCEEEDAKLILASSPEWAAERYMQRCWSDMDWADELLVHVRDAQGILTVWNVKAEPDVAFRAARVLAEESSDP